MKRFLLSVGVATGTFLLLKPKNRPGVAGLGGFDGARHMLYSMPKKWWIADPTRHEKDCYQSKTEALMRFAQWNSNLIENYQGIDHDESPAEFDAINRKYGLQGKSRVTNIAQALWVAMPPGRPYCMSNIDLDALNKTSPALEDPTKVGFTIPDYAEMVRLNKEQAERWRIQMEEEAERGDEPVPF